MSETAANLDQKQVASIVEQVMKAMLPAIGHAVQAARLSPEDINEMKKPFVDHAKEATNARLRKMTQAEIARGLEERRLRQEGCSHVITAPGGLRTTAISPVYNTINSEPPNQPRGLCVRCEKWFMPQHWVVDYNKDDPAGTYRLVPQDKDYAKILEIVESQVSGNNYY
jgi:hypothetical protein